MAGLGRGERGLNRLEVAHLADQDHVGILAQRRAQGRGEGQRVDADLALVDDRALVANQELDRVLDRHDVAGAIRVDVVDHRRERRRLAATGGPGHQNETARLHGDALDDLGQVQLVDRLHAEGDHAEDDADGAALHERVDAEAAQARKRVGEVDLVGLLEVRLLPRRHDRLADRVERFGLQALAVLQRHQCAVQAEQGRQARLQMDVGGVALDRNRQDFVELHVRPGSPRCVRKLATDGSHPSYLRVNRRGSPEP